MKTTTFFTSIISILLPLLVNAQCINVTFQSRDFNGFPISCHNAADGSVNALAQGSGSNFTYLWSTGSTSSRISNLSAGTYTVTVTDDLGCSVVESVSLVAPAAITFNTATLSTAQGYNVRCHGEATAFVRSTASGGTGNFTYQWSSGHDTDLAANLSAGAYSLTVSDDNGCIATNSVVMTEPAAVSVTAIVVSQPSAPGATDAEVQAIASGGSFYKYTFEWSNGATTASVFDLRAGRYSVKVKDIYNCAANASVIVVDPVAFSTGGAAQFGSNNTQLRPVMPQLVTPNTAGFNSNFTIKNIENFQDTELTIYNMMGQQLASYKNYSNEWSGVNGNNEELANGTYVAVLKYKVDGVAEVMTTQVVVAR
jgi:gliding motility-associated-like protein